MNPNDWFEAPLGAKSPLGNFRSAGAATFFCNESIDISLLAELETCEVVVKQLTSRAGVVFSLRNALGQFVPRNRTRSLGRYRFIIRTGCGGRRFGREMDR